MLINQLKADQLSARKKGMPAGKYLTTLIAEIEMVGKNARNGASTEDEAIGVIKKFIKGVIETYKLKMVNGTDDELAILNHELQVYEQYLPKQLSLEELKVEVSTVVAGATDEKGSALEMRDMKYCIEKLTTEHGDGFDKKSASLLIRELIMRK